MRATGSSWKHLDPPDVKESLGFEALFTDEEAERLMLGLIPKQMEDKWFVYYEDGWLRFHRSWTGAFIYGLRLDGSPAGVRVIDSWVNRNMEQYAANDTDYDRKLVRFVIDAFLLKNPGTTFPMPPSIPSAPTGVVQHSLVGRAYPEKDSQAELGSTVQPSSSSDSRQRKWWKPW